MGCPGRPHLRSSLWPHPRPTSATDADTHSREVQRPHCDRSQMRHPGIPGMKRWAEVGPAGQGLQSRPSRNCVWEEMRSQAQDGWGPRDLDLRHPRGCILKERASGAHPSLPVYAWISAQESSMVAAKKHSSDPPKSDEREGRGS